MSSDTFGKLVASGLRDVSIAMCEGILEGRFDSPGHREYQTLFAGLTDEAKRDVQRLVAYCIDGGINDFLHALQRETDVLPSKAVSNPTNLYFGSGGWVERFSKYPRS